MANLPSDPLILFSYVNTHLRDDDVNLNEFCSSLGVDKSQLENNLSLAGYFYDEKENKFRPRG